MMKYKALGYAARRAGQEDLNKMMVKWALERKTCPFLVNAFDAYSIFGRQQNKMGQSFSL